MIKLSTTSSFSPKVNTSSCLKYSKSFNYTNSTTFNSLELQKVQNYMSPCQKIYIRKSQLGKQKQIYQWRRETEFPIVKIKSYQLLSEKVQNDQVFSEVSISVESQLKCLSEIQKIPFFQCIYIIKQSLIGFERLFQRFGSFSVFESMIKFNKKNQCKVWINDLCFTNTFDVKSTTATQKQFIQTLLKILKKKISKTKNSQQFFLRIGESQYFVQAIKKIEEFSQLKRINIPNSLRNLEEGKFSRLLNSSFKAETLVKQSFHKVIESRSNIPTFLRNSIKQQKSRENFKKNIQRKISAMTQNYYLDQNLMATKKLSLHNNSKNLYFSKKRINTENTKNDDFLNDMNIRLVDPYLNEFGPQDVSPTLRYIPNNSYHQIFPQSLMNLPSKNPQQNENWDKISQMSFNKKGQKSQITSISNSKPKQKMFLTTLNQKVFQRNYSPISSHTHSQQISPKKSTKLKDLCTDFQSLQDFQNENKLTRDFSSTKLLPRQQRKLSGNLQHKKLKVRKPKIKLQTSQIQNKSLYSTNQKILPKTLSQVIISPPILASQTPQMSFLRDTIATQQCLGFQFFNSKFIIQESFIDQKQIPLLSVHKTSELKKLGGMGRDVRSSMVSQRQFDLEIQISKGQQIKNQMIELLVNN